MMVVIENAIDGAHLQDLREQLARADWETGARTATGHAEGRKNNLQLRDGTEPAVSLGQAVLQALWTNPLFISAALPRKIYPPRFNRYNVGQNYGAHVDAALMRTPGTMDMLRTDLSATLFLSDPDTYDGGALELETGFGTQSVKLAAGDLVLYLATSLHRVTPVTRGERLASFFWIESLVADDATRTSLFDLDQAIQRLTASLGTDHPEIISLSAIYHNLMRRSVIT